MCTLHSYKGEQERTRKNTKVDGGCLSRTDRHTHNDCNQLLVATCVDFGNRADQTAHLYQSENPHTLPASTAGKHIWEQGGGQVDAISCDGDDVNQKIAC